MALSPAPSSSNPRLAALPLLLHRERRQVRIPHAAAQVQYVRDSATAEPNKLVTNGRVSPAAGKGGRLPSPFYPRPSSPSAGCL